MTSATFASAPTVPVEVDEQLLFKYRSFAELPDDILAKQALKAFRYELDLPGYEARREVLERLRTWLSLERKAAKRLVQFFEATKSELESSERDEIAELERDAALDGLTYYEFRKLTEIMPSIGRCEAALPEYKQPTGWLASLVNVLAVSSWDSQPS